MVSETNVKNNLCPASSIYAIIKCELNVGKIWTYIFRMCAGATKAYRALQPHCARYSGVQKAAYCCVQNIFIIEIFFFQNLKFGQEFWIIMQMVKMEVEIVDFLFNAILCIESLIIFA